MNKLKSQLSTPQKNSEEREYVEISSGFSKDISHDKDLEKELVEIKAQLKSKTIELATIAKENEEKNEVLKNIRQQMIELVENPNSLNRRSKEINHLLDTHLNGHSIAFEVQIDELHQELFKVLRKKHPELTTNDLRLCAYIKIGLNSKELANLLNIKPSSVYISRSRLRKKLNLDTDIDLHAYLNSL